MARGAAVVSDTLTRTREPPCRRVTAIAVIIGAQSLSREVRVGPRRTLQVSLVVAAAVAVLLALTGVFSPYSAPLPPGPTVVVGAP